MKRMQSYFSNLQPCYLIAEIGVNHNGDTNLACKMIDAAKASRADAVKFQTFTAETLVSKGTPKVRYQESTTVPGESHYEMLRKLELKWEDHAALKEYSEKQGLAFISTPYDIDSARFLHEELDMTIFKAASADIVDLPLQKYIASTGKPAIVSVGMATLGEVETVAEIYRKANNTNMVLLHCVSNYPCADESLNLRVMNTLEQAFQIPVGYSDHSVGVEAAMLSIALGAKVIEKHFTLDKNLPGPDHRASSTPEEFSALVTSVRQAESMLGSPIKQCQVEEFQMSQVSRKSLHLARRVQSGSQISEDDLVLKRPGTGLAFQHLPKLINKIIKRDLEKDHQIDYSDVQ
jgi:N,N'-diacetyllegionaminate synthase